MEDYYQTLEVSSDASQETIKEQYHFLAQAWHPDKFSNPSQKLKAEEKIKEINAAYQTLGNPTRREEYDKKNRFSHSSDEQKYREQAHQRQSEDEQHRKEETARRAKEEQWQRERADRERKERINQLDQEISLLDQEIKKMSRGLPKMPNPIFSILLIIGGIYLPVFSASENSGVFLVIGGTLVVIGIGFIINRNRFYKEKCKPAFDEIEKRKQRLTQLVRERRYLK